ncbi:metal ABC transporter permease [Pararhodobacter sp.]|uniref:metal ABC transporter permease n=1 Tax=Pararhodobacter sp. TaxID=2127056 RepID=UPI002AFEEB0F|nr:metal ABC transporter permease [Pararhodobacter sp.]
MIIDAFVLRALGAGLLAALATGPLGCFVVWRRMAYFGDATAHAAILGVALALGFNVSIFAGTLVTAFAMALMVSSLAGRGWAMDTTLGVLAHSALALGLVAASFLQGVRVDLEAFLFGDILTVQASDLIAMALGTAAVTALMLWRWEALLTATISEDLARSLGLKPEREGLILTLALALVVAVALKVVGALLIGALLVIPPATARVMARTPERMALGAVAVAGLSVVLGLMASLWFDTPAGPSIVAAAAGLFVLSLSLGRVVRA